MAGLNGLLGIARDAMSAQSYGLSVTGQNVSNVNTSGYVRRDAVLETVGNTAAPLGGVRAKGTRRAADELIERRWYQSNSYASAASYQDAALSQVESLFNESAGAGLQSDLQALFSSFAELTATPSDASARNTVLARAEDLAARFTETASGLNAVRSDLLSRAEGIGKEVNQLVSQIADLNGKILVAESGGDVAADLRDQQGELVRQLSERVEVNVLHGSDGMVVLAGGVALVDGANAAQLRVGLDGNDQLEFNVTRPSGVEVDIAGKLDGGALAGIRLVRDEDIMEASSALDQLAYDLATAVNQQHAAGFGLDGVSGRNLFTVSAPPGSAYSLAVDPSVDGNPDAIGAASIPGTLPGGADNAVALASLSSEPIASGGTRTAVEAYGDLVGKVGSTRASAAREVEVRGAMQEQIEALRDSISGVSLDEEMVSLTRYQRAYEAATKLVSTVDELLGALISQL